MPLELGQPCLCTVDPTTPSCQHSYSQLGWISFETSYFKITINFTLIFIIILCGRLWLIACYFYINLLLFFSTTHNHHIIIKISVKVVVIYFILDNFCLLSPSHGRCYNFCHMSGRLWLIAYHFQMDLLFFFTTHN